MIWVSVAIFLSCLVPVATGVFYKLIEDKHYDPEFDTFIFFISAAVLVWIWPISLSFAAIVGAILGIIALSAKATERLVSRRKANR